MLAVSNERHHNVSLYDAESGLLLGQFGSLGAHAGRFDTPKRLCFTHEGNLLVAEYGNKRIQEVREMGEPVRLVGVGVFSGGVHGVACTSDVIVASQVLSPASMINVFDFTGGELLHSFGTFDAVRDCFSVCLGSILGKALCVIVPEYSNSQLTAFTLEGEVVRHFGAKGLSGPSDVCQTRSDGELVVVDNSAHIIHVLAGNDLLKSFGGNGYKDGEFQNPQAVARFGNTFFVLDWNSCRIQVFE